MKTLIVGCGYVGQALAAQLAAQGHSVFGLRRSGPGGTGGPVIPGAQGLLGDITQPDDLARLPRGWDWVVNCVSSGFGGPEEYRRIYLEGMKNLLAWLELNPPRKFVYTSSTSVYAQSDGSIVDESSPAEPETETGQILAETERVLLGACREEGFPGVILRLAGIYGPDRGYWLRQFVAGQARLEGGGERILNMIHREDAAGAILAALERGGAGEIYNVADDEPVRQLDFFRWLAAELRREMPPAENAPGPGSGKRGATNKRISNRKLRRLGWRLRFPTFREGCRGEIARLGLQAGSD